MKYSKSPRSQSRQSSRKSSRKFPKSPSHSRHSSRVSRPVSSRQPSRPMSGRHPSRPVSRPASRPASSRLHYPIAFKAMNSKSEYPEEDDPLKDCGDCIPESEGNAWCFLFYGFIASQTSLPALILYMNLFWYLFIMSTIGFRNMTNELWLQCMSPNSTISVLYMMRHVVISKNLCTKFVKFRFATNSVIHQMSTYSDRVGDVSVHCVECSNL